MVGLSPQYCAVVKQDWPIPIDVIKEIHNMLDENWRSVATQSACKQIAEIGALLVGTFCTGFQGEKMLLIELTGMAKSLKHLANRTQSFDLTITGPTKGNCKTGSSFNIPCVAVTQGTCLQSRRWLKHLVG